MSDIYDVLETCLQSLEKGAPVEAVLDHYPEYAEELRPILNASLQARGMAASDPSPDTMRRGRAKLLQRAAEMRAVKTAAPRRMIPGIPRFALSFILAALFLLSGTGLVRASTTALPGENLYPVKRTWEDMRLFFVFDKELRESLEDEFENERLHEVNELLTEGRDEMIQFAGIWLDVNSVYYASGIRVVILDTTKLPAEGLQNGAAVIVSGYTNVSGYVEAETIEVLPAGTNVPVGQPVEIESETEDHSAPDPGLDTNDQNENSNSNSGDGNRNENGNDDRANENGNENGNDSNDDQSNDKGNDNSNENGDENKDNNENSDEDNSGHNGNDDSSSGDDHSDDGEEDSSSGDGD